MTAIKIITCILITLTTIGYFYYHVMYSINAIQLFRMWNNIDRNENDTNMNLVNQKYNVSIVDLRHQMNVSYIYLFTHFFLILPSILLVYSLVINVFKKEFMEEQPGDDIELQSSHSSSPNVKLNDISLGNQPCCCWWGNNFYYSDHSFTFIYIAPSNSGYHGGGNNSDCGNCGGGNDDGKAALIICIIIIMTCLIIIYFTWLYFLFKGIMEFYDKIKTKLECKKFNWIYYNFLIMLFLEFFFVIFYSFNLTNHFAYRY